MLFRLVVALASVLVSSAAVAQNFPSAHVPAPNWWPPSQPKFVLSDQYPSAPPPAEAYPWKELDFRTQGIAYLRRVLAYFYEGNIEGVPEQTWQVHRNPVRKWYHAPWMHHDKNGREFVRGLTRERTSIEGELWSDPPNPRAQNWAVGFYNAPGGYVLGRVWKDPANPTPAAGGAFPDGTVAAKLLFTTATPQDVPYLKGSIEWVGHIHASIDCRLSGLTEASPLCERTIQTLRLLQIDVAVPDSRANSASGWVFGTFVYDGFSPGRTGWERMVPVGIMWGNDPCITPDDIKAGQDLRETVINRIKLPSQHLGCAGRLNGPVDNPVSSCMSCHGKALFPSPADMTPRVCDGSVETMKFFANINKDTPRPPGTVWLDYSLQLSVGLRNFCAANQQHALCAAPPPAAAGAPGAAMMPMAAPDVKERALWPRPTRGD